METFYLGTHLPNWLWTEEVEVPLFVSRVALERRKKYHPAKVDWALDSGGFSELTTHGRWTLTPEQYVEQVKRFQREIGRLQWAASMDYMCEPPIRKKTNLGHLYAALNDPQEEARKQLPDIPAELAKRIWEIDYDSYSVRVHQKKTTEAYLRLLELAPDLPWVPVVQGWDEYSYGEHIEEYLSYGIDLTSLPLVGVGSVCRRQAMEDAEEIIKALYHSYGIKNIHGFGFKTTGLKNCQHLLKSADSLSWSFHARINKISLQGHSHICNNCLEYALLWRKEMLEKIGFKESDQIVEQLSLLDLI